MIFSRSRSAKIMFSGEDTAAARMSASQTPMSVGRRDQLGLNRPDSELRPGTDMLGGNFGDDVSLSATSFATSVGGRSMSIRERAKAERKAIKRARKELLL